MEPIAINAILVDDITKLSHATTPPQDDMRRVKMLHASLALFIDYLGEQSAAAQGLNKVITSSDKLRSSPNHNLYLLKDSNAKGGKGDIIGMLKVGRKHLFLFDEYNKMWEVEPLCVLDFFILRDRQRHGYGKVLFDYMLKDMNTAAHELAIDGPSPKMEQFLHKNYGIEKLLKQNNNFAVAPQFFAEVEENHKSGRSTPVVAPAVGRFSAAKPASDVGMVIHGVRSYLDSHNGSASMWTSERAAGASGILSKQKPEVKPQAEPEVNPQAEPEAKPQVKPAPAEAKPQAEGETAPESKKSPERPSTLSVEPSTESTGPELSPAGSTVSRRGSQLTDQGFFDVKFYHNKLW